MAITNKSTLQSTYALPDGTTQTVTTQSNQTTSYNVSEDFTKVKSASKTFGQPQDTITYTVVLTNRLPYEVTSVSFADTLSSGATFVSGSVTVDGTAQPTLDPSAFTLPSSITAEKGTVTVTYQATIDADVTASTVTNYADVTYTAGGSTFTERTNTVSVDVVNNKISIVKTASSNVVKTGDTLTFTSVVTNNGTITNTSLTFTDAVPSGTTFDVGSVTVNGTSQPTYNPEAGFALPDLAGGESVTVVFTVTVI